uniref:Capping protein inhibiting regulator of actin dynamics n=1 Tax=Cynoglossus semilaevis TaxID=244447 RepID=A0A3P8UZT1_CYNSE
MSQENVSDKVRNLQRQIAQGIKFGQRPPSLRRSEGDEGSSDEEEVPQSPLKVLAQVEAEPHSTPVKSPRSKRVLPPTGTIESINLDAVPQSGPRLDNAAAKHKLSIKPKNQRVSRKHRRFTQETIKKQRLHEEEKLEARRKRELEEQRLRHEEEERRKRAEELRLREIEEENERCRKQKEEEEQRRLKEEEEEEKKIRVEEERRRREEEERKKQEERMMREEEERQEREREERRQMEERRRKEEAERRKQQEKEEAEKKRKLKEEEKERKKREEAEKLRLEEEEKKKLEEEEKQRKKEEQRKLLQEVDEGTDPQERKRRAEELRWKEMDERQRPFSFKVSSGENQILFQKVNLTPVTPASSHQSGGTAEQGEGVKVSPPEGPESPNLPASSYVPHTAILVTGAQLCGPAVKLDQIRDTACKSLLGLGDDRKAQGTPPMKSKTSPDRKSGKTKSLTEATVSSDADVLAEWASIRSKIFKGVEEGKYEDYLDGNRKLAQPSGEDQPAFPHANLRKTMSASAKFSITPARMKFGDSNRNSEVFCAEDKEVGELATPPERPTTLSPTPTNKTQNKTSKTVRIVERGSEECVFAKDLPSFLVPSPGAKSDGAELKSRSQSETGMFESREEGDEQDGEENPSPFGIKLRRTNYSLRFHSEQSSEKRKKRYSAGDSFDGVPSPLTPMESDFEVSSVFSDKSSPDSPQREGNIYKYLHASPSPSGPRAKLGKSPSPTSHSEGEKVFSKPPPYRRSATSPKPTGSVLTPPPSPLPKLVHGPSCDASVQRTACVELFSREQTLQEPSPVAQVLHSSQGQVHGEEEPKEKRSFFPSINIPWREKVDRKTELIKKDKPSLQSRHSLDSTRVQEKEAGPLWITLALQKQKGFREQQQSREERRSQRETKLAEKQVRDSSPTEGKSSGCFSLSKPQTPEEPKRPESLLGRLERKEQLKKANTLPSSVTEIADSTPSPTAVKEVSKRFPSSDSPQVSTEPAWLALAKRKAKAWSDCPQIIK